MSNAYIDYYKELCPSEESWVHRQLSNEREKLEDEIVKLRAEVERLKEQVALDEKAKATMLKVFYNEQARAERADAESIQLKKTNIENADSYRLMQGRVIAAEAEVERLKARLYQGCDDERDMAISEGPGHSTCGLADELTARAERAEAEVAEWQRANLELHHAIQPTDGETLLGAAQKLRNEIDALNESILVQQIFSDDRIRANEAEAELAAERKAKRDLSEVISGQDKELAKERANSNRYKYIAWKSDTNPIMVYRLNDNTLLHGYDADEAIDKAMKDSG